MICKLLIASLTTLVLTPTLLFAQDSCETLLSWSALISAKKVELLQSYDHPISSDEKNLDELEDQKLQRAILSVISDALASISAEEIEGDKAFMTQIASYGEPSMSFIERFFVEDQVVAVRLHFWQDGGAMADRSNPSKTHYKNEGEAIAAGLDVNADVNWQAEAIYEWDGNQLTPLTYKDIEGRGFVWGGW